MSNVRDGHETRIREEIYAYVEAFFEETGLSKPPDHDAYVQEQTNLVLEKLYADPDLRPEEEDPDIIEGDYYRKFIADYSSVYTDYPVEIMDKM